MVLVARPTHGSIEERHTRHERRYSPALRSSIGCTQEIERRVRRRAALVGCGRAFAARRREEARAGGAPCVVPAGPAQARAHRAPAEEMLRLRMFAIAAGYEDADDCASLRYDPIFKMAVGHAPESDDPLCSQPTMSRLENAPSKIEIARLMAALVDGFCESYRRAPSSITLDIDDTCDTVHGHQQLSLFNAHYDERCFLPIHIYEAASGKPVAMILREGKTPSGEEVGTVLKHVIKRIRRHWPKVHILVRGDSHYGRDEAMEWCEETEGVDYVFGFAGNDVLHALTREAADAIAALRVLSSEDKLRGFKAFRYGAKSWARSGASWRASRQRPRGWMSAMSSPRSKPAPASLRDPLLRARERRELHQAAQEPTRFRPHLLPRSQSQPVPLDSAHRRLLALACNARRCSEALAAIDCRVRNDPPSADQDRCARRGGGRPHPCLSAHSMSRSRCLPRARRSALRRRTIAIAALSPHRALRRNLQQSKIQSWPAASPSSDAIAATRLPSKNRVERAQLRYFGQAAG